MYGTIKMVKAWTKEKIYITGLFIGLILAIASTLFFNRKGEKRVCNESYDIRKRKIFILYSGGVMGMNLTNKGYISKHGFLEEKLSTMTKKVSKIAPYDIVEYSPLLESASMKPKNWTQIGLEIAKRYDQYDAFVVIHGVDTMSYTASALSFMFENLGKPVIITGSTLSLEDPISDGRNNLLTSLILASRYKFPEVVICFGNKIIRGNRSIYTYAISSEAFSSPNYPLIGKMGSMIRLDDKMILPHPKDSFKFLHINPKIKVTVIKVFPGINANYLAGIMKSGPVHGIILETYGVGEGPTDKSFIELLQTLIEKGIVVVSISQAIISGVNELDYSTMLKKIGVISGGDMTTEAALTKLYFLLSNISNPTMNTMSKLIPFNIRGEVDGGDIMTLGG